MCFVVKCFGWVLDFVQSCITFALACLLGTVICIALVIAIASGIAYGYHYSLAEFLTFTRHDTTLYVRRGHFQDRPEINFGRRSGDEEDLFSSNRADYQDVQKIEPKPLSDTWSKVQETKNYADKLNKFSDLAQIRRKFKEPEILAKVEIDPTTSTLLTRLISYATVPPSHDYIPPQTEIIMRKFKPVHEKEESSQHSEFIQDEDFYSNVPKYKSKKKDNDKKTNKSKSKFIPMRHWGVTTVRSLDGGLDDVDEDHVVYKPV